MQKRIYFKEIKKLLQCSDDRTIWKWCKDNDVPVFKDNGSIKPFVFELDFIKAYNRPILQSPSKVNAVMNFTTQYLTALEETKGKYKSNHETESDFIKMLRNIKPDI